MRKRNTTAAAFRRKDQRNANANHFNTRNWIYYLNGHKIKKLYGRSRHWSFYSNIARPPRTTRPIRSPLQHTERSTHNKPMGNESIRVARSQWRTQKQIQYGYFAVVDAPSSHAHCTAPVRKIRQTIRRYTIVTCAHFSANCRFIGAVLYQTSSGLGTQNHEETNSDQPWKLFSSGQSGTP